MKRRLVVKLSFIAGLMLRRPVSYASETIWTPLLVNRPVRYSESKIFSIAHPGKYFLNQDHIQCVTYLDSDGGKHRPTGGPMLSILCGEVELDFRGHLLGAEVGMSGIILQPAMNIRFAERFSQPASFQNRNVLLSNGTIDLARGENTGDAICFVNIWDGHNRRTFGRPDDSRGRTLSVTYEKNDYRFERLKVLANKVGLTVEGTHTVIRDCIVESADLAAIFIAGDHVLIENCEIRLRKPSGILRGHRAAIVLRDGSNAVIRNNRIRVDYGSTDEENAHCILVQDGAVDVLIENNSFINIKGDPVTLSENSQAVIRNNKFERSWF